MLYYGASVTLVRHGHRVGLLLWAIREEDIPPSLRSPFSRGRWRTDVPVVVPGEDGQLALERIDGWWLSAHRAAQALAPLSLTELHRLPPSAGVWALASKWVIEAMECGQMVPSLSAGRDNEHWSAHWRSAPVRPEDRSRLAGLAAAMPGVSRAWPVDEAGTEVMQATHALHEFLDAAVDGLMRSPTSETAPRPGSGPAWVVRLADALSGPEPGFTLQGLSDRHLPAALGRWIAPAVSLGSGGRPIVGFRLEEPTRSSDGWRLTYHLLDADAVSRVSVADLRAGAASAKEAAARMTKPGETLFEALGRCSRTFPAISRSLAERLPDGVAVDATEAWDFLTTAALKLQKAGYWIDVPSGLSMVGRRRVRARMRVGADIDDVRSSELLAGMVSYRWEASLGDDTLTPDEFRRLAAAKAPLVQHRGQWVAVDPRDVARLERLMERGGGEIEAAEALRLALAGEVGLDGDTDGAVAEVVGDGAVLTALDHLMNRASGDIPDGVAPDGLEGELRPYQLRGLAWLESVTKTGFGACLADDMGLGKTVQLLAQLQQLSEGKKGKHYLVVCPTSVLGNWRREVQRFTPRLATVLHHGPSRSGTVTALRDKLKQARVGDGVIVVTSYALVRRDIDMFRRIMFDAVILDEAQNIKNPEAAQSKAVRELKARRRVALTGTPVENRLTELWSIMDFLNPGLLGSRASFKRAFALPVERYGDEDAAARLRRVTAPFIMRRLKTDPDIAPDLPDKVELVRYCPLMTEQAALYQAVLERAMDEISSLDQGMERRGRILAMLTALKQICNHPAHYLRDGRVDPRRSGKMQRFLELVDEVRSADGHPLVFTQYREMGELLRAVLEQRLGTRVPFYHGGLPRSARDRMVGSFQDPHGPPIMIVSLKAGGTGLNLTRANHVFHYDRWWNPAVEDQATDRAFRIGQTRDVTVHRMVSQATLEEQIHRILEEKRALADRVIGSGETWLSELDDATLHDLVSLGQDAVLDEDDP